MDIPSCQIGPGTSAKAFVFETSGTVGSGRQGWLFPAAALNAGLFVSGDDVVVSTQRGAFPDAFVQIKDGASFVGKVGIAREDPASMLPRTEGIAAEPTPQSGTADLGNQALRNYVLPDLLDREAGQRKPEAVRKFAGQCLNLYDETGGKSGPYARREAEPPGRAFGREQIACATC